MRTDKPAVRKGKRRFPGARTFALKARTPRNAGPRRNTRGRRR